MAPSPSPALRWLQMTDRAFGPDGLAALAEGSDPEG